MGLPVCLSVCLHVCLSVCLPACLSFSCRPASSMKHCWTIFHSLFIDKLLLVTGFPRVNCFPMLHPICVIALLCVSSSPNLCRPVHHPVLIFKLNSLPRGSKEGCRTGQLVVLVCALLFAT